jgi:hypothetical protein
MCQYDTIILYNLLDSQLCKQENEIIIRECFIIGLLECDLFFQFYFTG